MVESFSTSGTSPCTILRARPSAMAVLPTPGSPTNSGLFFCRRHSTWMVRSTSCSRPISGIDAAALGLLVEVDAVGVERVLRLLLLLARLRGAGVLVDAAHGLGVRHAGPLGDAVADVLHGVEARHLLLLQEEGGVALALGEDGDQHVGAGDFLAAGGLHVHDGAVDDALEAGGGLGLGGPLQEQRGELVVDVFGDAGAQPVDVDRAGAHDGRGVAVVEERQQEVLQRGVLVVTLVGVLEGAMQGSFKALRECGHGRPSLLFHGTLQRMLVLA